MTHSNSPVKSGFILFILMLTIAIDVMGLGLIFPIIPEIILDPHNSLFFNITTPNSIRYFWYGMVFAMWPLGMFFGSSIFGRLSDQYGRKKLLLTSLFGVSVSYFLSVIAIGLHSVVLFTVSRLTVGIFGGSFALAQATIIDVSAKDKVARNLSYVTLAGSIGFIFGPLLTTVVGYISSGLMQAALPCLVAGVLSLINTLSVYIFLKETRITNISERLKIKILDMLFSFRVMFTDKRIIVLALSYLLMQAAWGFYMQNFPLVLSEIYHLNQSEIGLSFVLAAIFDFITVLVILPFLTKRFPLKFIVILSGILLGLNLLFAVIIPNLWLQYVTFVIAFILQLVFYSAILAWLSHKVSEDEQGQIMGGTVSVFGLAWAINAILLGLFANLSILLPVYLAIIGFILAGVIAAAVKK
ncbi:MFS transporter [Thiotrichales bacterium 19S3-7]|nr:MFS transporter [Thiotrichales bacterium 19S3-7]MCF6802639.1 MFS transporter [Thiotrichales bacterium 19S3-11]